MPSPGMRVAGMRVDVMAAMDNPSRLFAIERERPSRSGCELAQHVVQDAAVAEVLDLVERIDPAHQRNLLDGAVRGFDLRRHALARLELAGQPADRDDLVAFQPEAR